MRQYQIQYLSKSNSYQAHLIELGEAGTTFIVESTDPSTEPHYEGYADESSATFRAAELTRLAPYLTPHRVFQIQKDADGDWVTTWEWLPLVWL